VQSNIRELEGALTRTVAFSDLSGVPLSPQLVESALADLLPRRSEVQPLEVVRRVAEAYGIPMDRMLGRDRTHEVALPRQIAMYLSKELIGASLPEIGRAFGGKDHTTVLHAVDKIQALLREDPKFKKTLDTLTQSINL